MNDVHPIASIVASTRFDDVAVLTFFVQERMRRGRKRRGRVGRGEENFGRDSKLERIIGVGSVLPLSPSLLAVKTSKWKERTDELREL